MHTLLVLHADPLLTLVCWPSKTERRPFEGSLGHIPRQSSPREASQSPSDSLTGSFASVSTNPTARRYSSRAKSRPDAWAQSASPTSADVERGESRRLRSGRNTLYKSSGITSPRTSTSPPTATLELDTVEKDTAGFLPKLSKILEGKEHNQQRCQKSSPASLREIQTPPYRNRVAEDASVVPRRTARQRHSSSQQRAINLANFSNPSLLSVQSGFTISSNTSSGSNSTVTQKSYDRSNMAKKKQAKGRRRIEMKRTSAKSNAMDALPDTSSVFQYLHEGLTPAQSHSGSGGRPGSSSSSTSLSSDAERDETSSSHDDEPIVESPMTTPPSTSRSLDKTSEPHGRLNYDLDISARGSSPKSNGHTHSGNQPSVHDSEEEEEEEEEEEKEEGEEEEEEEEAEEEKDDREGGDSEDDDDGEDEDQDASRNYSSEKAAPPVLPSDPTSHRKKDVEHDRHYQRLKDQEKDLREHVLQSPQPQRDFHFFGGPSPTPQPAIPFLDPHSQYDASANIYPQTPPVPGWRPAAPAPLPGDFYSPPQVPHIPLHTTDNIYAMTAGSIPGPPNTLAPPPPFQYPQVQPPHYLARPAGPDFSKTTVVGYELLADKLSEFPKENVTGEDKIIPMYRKFEQLNHRILLHLQDEISELEEELRYLDECIAQMSPVGKEGRPQPASRRMESHHGGELHWRRTNLLGRIYLKLGQYSERKASL